MTRKILTVIFTLAVSVSVAQTDAAKAKLEQAIQAAELDALSNDEQLQLSFYATQGFRVHESGKPGENYPSLSSVLKSGSTAPDYAAINQENFNPLLFNFGERSEHQFFNIDGTDKVVQIYEEGYCMMKYQQNKVTRENAEKRSKK